MTSTVSALEALDTLGAHPSTAVNTAAASAFLDSCAEGPYFRPVPGATANLRSTCQGLRAQALLGAPLDRHQVAAVLGRHAVAGGGFGAADNRVPDLLSTYQAALTADQFQLPIDRSGMTRLLDRLAIGDGYAWTPMAPGAGGPLARASGRMLVHWLSGRRPQLPPLNL